MTSIRRHFGCLPTGTWVPWLSVFKLLAESFDPRAIDPQVVEAMPRCGTDVDHMLLRTKQTLEVVRKPENTCTANGVKILVGGLQDHDARRAHQ